MIATLGLARLIDGRLRVEVERPQHPAKATRVYSGADEVGACFPIWESQPMSLSLSKVVTRT